MPGAPFVASCYPMDHLSDPSSLLARSVRTGPNKPAAFFGEQRRRALRLQDQDLLKSCGLRVKEVEGDGACLFRALGVPSIATASAHWTRTEVTGLFDAAATSKQNK